MYAAQVATLKDVARIVVPDWRQAPLSIWESWEAAARWVLAQAPAKRFALAGLSFGGMLAVEIMQIAAERVTKLALLGTNLRAQTETEQALRHARIRLANEGQFETVLGLQMSRFIPAYRLRDKRLVDAVIKMYREIGVEIYIRQEAMMAMRVDRRPDLPKIKCPTIVVCGRDDAAAPLFLSEEMAAAITGSEQIAIEQCGHLITMERPGETSAILREWLDPPTA
jgi:pimeloyl-ACP methyl ester carboxylesterase